MILLVRRGSEERLAGDGLAGEVEQQVRGGGHDRGGPRIAQVALVASDATLDTLEREAERLERRLDAVPGVRRADVWAVPEREVGVRYRVVLCVP